MQQDLRGQKCGSKTVIGLAPSKHRHTRYYVRCDCGHVSSVFQKELLRNPRDSCVKCRYEKSREKRMANLATTEIGKVYGMRTVLSVHHRGVAGYEAEAKCRCGFQSRVLLHSLRSGVADSCIKCSDVEWRKKNGPKGLENRKYGKKITQ